jgi:hypothetical protein
VADEDDLNDDPREAMAEQGRKLHEAKAKEARSHWFAQFYRVERVNNHIAERLRLAMESHR